MLSYYYIIWLYHYIIISEYYHIIILLYYISILYYYIGERLWGSSFLGSLRGEAPHKLQVGGEGEALPPPTRRRRWKGSRAPRGRWLWIGSPGERLWRSKIESKNIKSSSQTRKIFEKKHVLGLNWVPMAPFGALFGQK